MFAIPTVSLDPEGEIQYKYDFVWAQQQCTGLVHPSAGGNPYIPGKEHMTRYQSVWFTSPNDVKGTAFMNEWYYDQAKYPELFGYLPAFKRVRRFPTNQRFEPLVAGINLFLSDAWASGDPMLTWGNWKIIHRGPYLGAMHHNWVPQNENWKLPVCGGPKGQSYFYAGRSLIPEVLVLEGEPTGYPRAPLSKRRIYLDARNIEYPQAISFDRRGEIWKSFEPGFGQCKTDPSLAELWSSGPDSSGAGIEASVLASDGRPDWMWNWVISNDIQSKRITYFHQAHHCKGGWKSEYDKVDSEEFLSSYMTTSAMRRLGT